MSSFRRQNRPARGRCAAFLAAVRDAPFEGATLEDGYRALLVVEAAEEGARTGRPARVAPAHVAA
jgi:hypothetical protein